MGAVNRVPHMGSFPPTATNSSTLRSERGVLGLLLLVSACSVSVDRAQEGVPAPLVPFGDLFALDDTVRLDASIIIGMLSYVDIGPGGAFLVSDRASNRLHVFDLDGRHKRTLDPATCLPERSGLLRNARFVTPDRILSLGVSGQMVMFTSEGECVAVHVPRQGAKGACASGDTLHVLPNLMSLRKHSTTAYSMDLDEIGSSRIAVPKHPILYNSSSGMSGRAIECFGDGPYYIFAGRADAVPVRTPQHFIPAHPPFFVERTEDLPGGAGTEDLMESVLEYPMNFGIFKIDRQTRLVVYWLPREQVPANPGALVS